MALLRVPLRLGLLAPPEALLGPLDTFCEPGAQRPQEGGLTLTHHFLQANTSELKAQTSLLHHTPPLPGHVFPEREL